MRSAAALVLALAVSGAAADFSVTSGTTQQTSSTDSRISVVRQWTLTTSGSNSPSIDELKFQLPGRVFVSYLSSAPSGVAGYVNVSGDSTTVVEAVRVNNGDNDDDDDDSDDSDDGDNLHVKFDTSSGGSSGYLLTEVFLADQSSIKEVKSESSSDIIIESNVLLSSGTNSELKIQGTGSGSIFVSDDATAYSIKQFDAEFSGSGSFQLDVSSLTLTEEAKFQSKGSGGVNVFASSISTDDLQLDAENSGSICLAVTDISATESDIDGASRISLPLSTNKFSTTGSATCTETSVPDRTAKCIANGCTDDTATTTSGSTSTNTTTSTTTDTVGSSTTSTPTATPTPTPTSNSAQMLSVAAVAQVAVLAAVAMM